MRGDVLGGEEFARAFDQGSGCAGDDRGVGGSESGTGGVEGGDGGLNAGLMRELGGAVGETD